MSEHIEREAAIAAAFSATSLGNTAFRDVYDTVNRLRLIPSADVQPVRHGRWIKDSDGLTICSECEEVALQRVFIKLPEKIVDLQMQKSHYCPNCGAKMDLEE